MNGGGDLVTKSCPTPATPGNIAHQAPLSMGFSRQEYWSGLPFPSPEDLPNPRINPRSPALQADSLPTELLNRQDPLGNTGRQSGRNMGFTGLKHRSALNRSPTRRRHHEARTATSWVFWIYNAQNRTVRAHSRISVNTCRMICLSFQQDSQVLLSWFFLPSSTMRAVTHVYLDFHRDQLWAAAESVCRDRSTESALGIFISTSVHLQTGYLAHTNCSLITCWQDTFLPHPLDLLHVWWFIYSFILCTEILFSHRSNITSLSPLPTRFLLYSFEALPQPRTPVVTVLCPQDSWHPGGPVFWPLYLNDTGVHCLPLARTRMEGDKKLCNKLGI